MHLPKVIGLMGNIGSGKNTTAEYLRKQYNYRIRGFSDPLYQQLLILNPYIIEAGMRYNELVASSCLDSVKRKYFEVRTFLRLLGSECGREIHGNSCWVDYLDKKIHMDKDPRTVIHGVRFPEEVDYIRARDGFLIWISAPHLETAPTSSHASEISLNYEQECDFVLENVGTFEDLYYKIEKALDTYTQVLPYTLGDV